MFIFALGDDLALIPRTPAIAEAYHALLLANEDRLSRWDPGACPDPLTLENVRIRLQVNAHGWLAGAQIPVAIALRDGEEWRLAGAAALRLDDERRSAEVGYWVDAAFEGKGLVSRTVTALLDHAFGPLKLERVTLGTREANTRSRAVAERLGFTREDACEGERDDEVTYGLRAEEWKLRRRSRP